jgi:nitrite reductase/ring-hydroxylating ferredoxin subunit
MSAVCWYLHPHLQDGRRCWRRRRRNPIYFSTVSISNLPLWIVLLWTSVAPISTSTAFTSIHIERNSFNYCQRLNNRHTISWIRPNDDRYNEVIRPDDDLFRNLGGFLPFFASEAPKEEKKEEPPKGFWDGLFRRDTENKRGTKSREPPSKPKKSKEKIVKDKNRSKAEDKTESPSLYERLPFWPPFNTTKSDENKTPRRDPKDKQPDSNPISIVQKFASSMFKNDYDPFGKKSSKETWYPVFPKTRIMPGEMKPVTVAGLDLLVIASLDGKSLYCIANSCPHLGTPLETGKLARLPNEKKAPVLLDNPTVATIGNSGSIPSEGIPFSETDIPNLLSQDGCEDCIICPLHHTAFALQSGEVRGEWCPYPPVIGAIMGTVKTPTAAAVFEVRTRGKNIEVRLNSILEETG